MIHMPTFALQQNVHASASPTRSHGRDLSHAHDQHVLWIANRFIAHHRSITAQRRARSPLRNLVCHLHVPDQLSSLGRLQTFFRRTSCKIALSKLKSTTSLLSLEFSSSSCLSLGISVNPIAPNFFFSDKKFDATPPAFHKSPRLSRWSIPAPMRT